MPKTPHSSRGPSRSIGEYREGTGPDSGALPGAIRQQRGRRRRAPAPARAAASADDHRKDRAGQTPPRRSDADRLIAGRWARAVAASSCAAPRRHGPRSPRAPPDDHRDRVPVRHALLVHDRAGNDLRAAANGSFAIQGACRGAPAHRHRVPASGDVGLAVGNGGQVLRSSNGGALEAVTGRARSRRATFADCTRRADSATSTPGERRRQRPRVDLGQGRVGSRGDRGQVLTSVDAARRGPTPTARPTAPAGCGADSNIARSGLRATASSSRPPAGISATIDGLATPAASKLADDRRLHNGPIVRHRGRPAQREPHVVGRRRALRLLDGPPARTRWRRAALTWRRHGAESPARRRRRRRRHSCSPRAARASSSDSIDGANFFYVDAGGALTTDGGARSASRGATAGRRRRRERQARAHGRSGPPAPGSRGGTRQRAPAPAGRAPVLIPRPPWTGRPPDIHRAPAACRGRDPLTITAREAHDRRADNANGALELRFSNGHDAVSHGRSATRDHAARDRALRRATRKLRRAHKTACSERPRLGR